MCPLCNNPECNGSALTLGLTNTEPIELTKAGTSNQISEELHGYEIRAEGVEVSILRKDNGTMDIILNFGDAKESVECQMNMLEGENLKVNVKVPGGGEEKWVTIKVPLEVRMDEIKVETSGENIVISGPIDNITTLTMANCSLKNIFSGITNLFATVLDGDGTANTRDEVAKFAELILSTHARANNVVSSIGNAQGGMNDDIN